MKSMSLLKISSFPESIQNVKINLPNGKASEVIKKCTHAAPVPWPIIVTLRGSPPKCSIFSWTQWRAAIWSRIPKLEGFPLLFPSVLALRKPVRKLSDVQSNDIVEIHAIYFVIGKFILNIENTNDIVWAKLFNLFIPLLHFLERVSLSDIVDHKNTMRPFEMIYWHWLQTLLSCCIPDL